MVGVLKIPVTNVYANTDDARNHVDDRQESVEEALLEWFERSRKLFAWETSAAAPLVFHCSGEHSNIPLDGELVDGDFLNSLVRPIAHALLILLSQCIPEFPAQPEVGTVLRNRTSQLHRGELFIGLACCIPISCRRKGVVFESRVAFRKCLAFAKLEREEPPGFAWKSLELSHDTGVTLAGLAILERVKSTRKRRWESGEYFLGGLEWYAADQQHTGGLLSSGVAHDVIVQSVQLVGKVYD